MFKLLFLIGLIYLAYRLFMGPPLLKQGKRNNIESEGDDEYVDYEEVD